MLLFYDIVFRLSNLIRTTNAVIPVIMYVKKFFFIKKKLLLIYRYPKPGTKNPTITLKIADLADPKNIRTRDLTPPPILANRFVIKLNSNYSKFI